MYTEQNDSFIGQVALITGGGSGMGLASGKRLLAAGATVVLCDYDTEALERVQAQPAADPARLLCKTCDVRDFAAVEKTVQDVVDRFGRLDILINCAGGNSARIFGDCAEFPDRPMEHIRFGIEVNLMGVVHFCHEAMRQMRAQKHGSIINIGSITGLEGDTCGSDYAISKSAIMNGLNKSFAQWGAPYGVRVNCVAPGPVLTRPAMANMKTPLGRAAQPDEIVDMILYLASDNSSFVTGSMFLLDGGRHLMTND